jgi:rare lipoprotein A
MRKIIAIFIILIVSGCSTNQVKTGIATSTESFHYQKPPTPSLVLESSQTSPKLPTGPLFSLNKPDPLVNEEELKNNDSFLNRISRYIKKGIASWYGPGFHGRKTATGEIFDMYEMTAAHKTLPIPSYAEVTNLANNKTVVVKINDRGPYVGNRLLDLSYAAAKKLGIKDSGTGKVEIKSISPLQALPQIQKSAENQNKNVFLELGNFSSRIKAANLHRKLTALHLVEPVILASKVSKKSRYKVQMGPIKSSKSAEVLSYQLAKLGIKDPQIVTETKQN